MGYHGRALFVLFDENANRLGKVIRCPAIKQKTFLKALTVQIEEPNGDAVYRSLAFK